MTKLGLSSGWCRSMLIVSPERVRAPLASTVGDDGGTRCLLGHRGPEAVGQITPRDRLLSELGH
jgi:hypothetical protein